MIGEWIFFNSLIIWILNIVEIIHKPHVFNFFQLDVTSCWIEAARNPVLYTALRQMISVVYCVTNLLILDNFFSPHSDFNPSQVAHSNTVSKISNANRFSWAVPHVIARDCSCHSRRQKCAIEKGEKVGKVFWLIQGENWISSISSHHAFGTLFKKVLIIS